MVGITGNSRGVVPGLLYAWLRYPGMPACKNNVQGIFLVDFLRKFCEKKLGYDWESDFYGRILYGEPGSRRLMGIVWVQNVHVRRKIVMPPRLFAKND